MLQTIDEYARTKKYLMNVGNDKGNIVAKLIAEVKPHTMVELGGYVDTPLSSLVMQCGRPVDVDTSVWYEIRNSLL